MSYLYSQDPVEQAKAFDLAATHTGDLPQSGFFSGAVEAPLTGVFSGLVAKPALMLGDAVTPVLTSTARDFGAESVAQWLENEQQKNVEMLKSLRERSATYGTAGQVLHGIADVLPEAVAGAAFGGLAGAAAVPGVLQGYADARLGMEDGLDAATAIQKGAITGTAMGLGALLPMSVGAKTIQSALFGATTNVGLGMAQRGATAALLESRGYGEMAQQYQWLDKEAIAVDAVLGVAFGVLGAKMSRRPTTEEIDSALIGNERQHVEIEAQPGVHTSVESRQAGVRAFEKALDDMLGRGETPDVSALAPKIDVVPNPETVKFHEAVAKEVAPEIPKVEAPVEAPKIEMAPATPHFELVAKLDADIARLQEEAKPQPVAEGEAAKPVAPEVERQLEQAQALKAVAESVAAMRTGDAIIVERPGKTAEALVVERTGDTVVLKDAKGNRVETVLDNGAAGKDVVRFADKVKTGEYKIPERSTSPVADSTDASLARSGNVDAVSADMARQILDTYPDLTIPTEAGERRLAEVLAESDAEIAQAQKDSILHDVAVACFLRG